jgi:uncharacterized protein YdeI (YjbR/CyaY-like superfamily)
MPRPEEPKPARRSSRPKAAAPTFFATALVFHAWLARHGAAERELIVGFHKVGSGRPSMTWPESVDEALCFGWIDGMRARLDDSAYTIRFTPRRVTSTWSAVNIARVAELTAQARMKPPGLEAFAQRREERSELYSYEQRAQAALAAEDEAQFRRNAAAWRYFEAQPPGYRHLVIWRIVSARRSDTQQRRLAQLIEASQNQRRL